MPQNPDTPVTLAPVGSESEAEWVRDLLSRSGLPTADLQVDGSAASTGGTLTLYAIEAGGERVGCIGLERYGDAGLLRSAAVAEPYRGRGYGRGGVRALETHASDAGIETLYLLTTTASAFFATLGYERTSRDAVPETVRGSTEFSDICPDSATVMSREL